MYSLCLDYIKLYQISRVLLGEKSHHPTPTQELPDSTVPGGMEHTLALSRESHFPLFEVGFSLKSWADFTLILLPSLQFPLLILSPMEV